MPNKGGLSCSYYVAWFSSTIPLVVLRRCAQRMIETSLPGDTVADLIQNIVHRISVARMNGFSNKS